MKCKHCKGNIKENQFFCIDCGAYMGEKGTMTPEIITEYEMKLKQMVEEINRVPHMSVSWNPAVDQYVRVMERLKAVLAQPEFQSIDEQAIIRKLDSFMERCKEPEFHIAFVGTIKAGKSTLINALLGRNLASTSVTPETAVLTKFRHCSKGNYVKIKFYNTHEWDALWSTISNNADVFLEEYKALNGEAEKAAWLNKEPYYKEVAAEQLEDEIERWTSSKKVEHYFVKEVEVGLQDFAMPEEVVFVDTPGLDDAVRYRSDVTRNYIDRANAVFACVKSDALTGQELNTLYRVFANTSYNPEKVFVIGTQWDVLNDPVEDWKMQKAEWVKYLSRQDCYGSKEVAQRNITYAAAYIHNLIRDYDQLDAKGKRSLMAFGLKFDVMPDQLEAEMPRFLELGNISTVERKIKTDIVGRYSEYLFKDIEQSYLDIKKELMSILGEMKKTQLDILETSSKDISEIRKEHEKAQKELQEVKEYQTQLVTMLQLVREETNKRVETLCKQLREMV